MQINLHQPESCCLVRIEGWHLIWCPQFLCWWCADVFHPKFNFIAHQAMLDRLVWYVRPPRDVEAIADCSRQSFNRSVLPTKAATYESRFTIHRPTQMDSMTNMAAIQMIHTIQGQECRGGNEEQQIVRSRNACSRYAARRYKCSQLAAELGQKSRSLKPSQGSRGLCEGGQRGKMVRACGN